MVQRDYWMDRIERAWEHRSVVWLSGVRRVGKTTLTRSLPDAEYFDCERPSIRRQFADPERLLASLRPQRVVFDEVHRLENPSELLKLAADYHPEVKVVATGSSTMLRPRLTL